MRKKYRRESEVKEDIHFLSNSIRRLSESFRLEKDAALEGGLDALEKLREREKTHYTPATTRMINDLRQLRYRLRTLQWLPPAIFLSLDELETQMKEAGAHFTGTVNRLIRCRSQEEDECTE